MKILSYYTLITGEVFLMMIPYMHILNFEQVHLSIIFPSLLPSSPTFQIVFDSFHYAGSLRFIFGNVMMEGKTSSFYMDV
jgi:hypothetical protein